MKITSSKGTTDLAGLIVDLTQDSSIPLTVEQGAVILMACNHVRHVPMEINEHFLDILKGMIPEIEGYHAARDSHPSRRWQGPGVTY